MTLSDAIANRKGQRATTANRIRQERAELRIDEIVSVSSIDGDYRAVDCIGDLLIQRQFQSLYALVDTEQEKAAVAAAFAVWVRTERAEEQTVTGSVAESVELLKANNRVWIDGAAVPPDSDGAA